MGQWTNLDLVQNCPAAKDTTYKIPANDPSYHDKNSTGGNGSTTGGSSSAGASSTSTGGGSAGTVRAGSFCSPVGATGVSSTGKPMLCGPASDGRNRWKTP